MIIGINGYIGSGKDTVGQLIQYIICMKKGILAPRHQDFKDFPFAPISNARDSGWEIKKFAAKLKQIASLLTGIPVEKFEDQEFKKTLLNKDWDSYGIVRGSGNRIVAIQTEPHPKESIWFSGPEKCNQIHLQMTVRELLQKLGTEAIRDGLHQNAWVNALFADYQIFENLNGKGFQISNWNDYPNWIITDCRFPNEAQAIENRGGFIVRVNRGEKTSNHPSETSLDNWEFDYVIENDDDIESLTEKVSEMLKYFKIIS